MTWQQILSPLTKSYGLRTSRPVELNLEGWKTLDSQRSPRVLEGRKLHFLVPRMWHYMGIRLAEDPNL